MYMVSTNFDAQEKILAINIESDIPNITLLE